MMFPVPPALNFKSRRSRFRERMRSSLVGRALERNPVRRWALADPTDKRRRRLAFLVALIGVFLALVSTIDAYQQGKWSRATILGTIAGWIGAILAFFTPLPPKKRASIVAPSGDAPPVPSPGTRGER
jgi:regulator of protease activity HflC (stomatin/prohibitin superfamily)